MRIESGPTGERKVRTLLLFLMVAVFAAWFAYDGLVGYPKENFKEHLDQLSPEDRAKAESAPSYGSVDATKTVIVRAIIKGDMNRLEKLAPELALSQAEKSALSRKELDAQRATLTKLMGGPPSYEAVDAWHYFGPSFRMRIRLENGKPNGQVLARKAVKTSTTIAWQKGIAVVLGVLALYLLWFLLKVRSTWLVLDDQGLDYRGRAKASWDAMKKLDTSRFHDKGYVDLVYEEGGREKRVRLDEYHLARFDDIIDEICAHKHFENPLPVAAESEGGQTPPAKRA